MFLITFAATMSKEQAIFDRSSLLLGDAAMDLLASKRVIVFGIGGVGSWCAEGLIRSGLRQLTIVDSDTVQITNVNRQSMATMKTIGMNKTDALKSKLLDINPQAMIEVVFEPYSAETRDRFNLANYDYIIDAIDSLSCKADLILHATSLPATTKFFSSMGAALKLNPSLVRVDEFWKVQGCPLARALRQRFKRSKVFPAHKFLAVYSPEVQPNRGRIEDADSACLSQWDSRKAQVNGSLVHITGIFGFTLAGLVIQDICAAASKATS